MKPGKKGIPRVIDATKYSMQGFQFAWKNEAAFREEILLAILLFPIAFWLGENNIERVLMIGSGLLVLIVELLNSAIEAVVDRAGKEFHELAGAAKDMGSAAVLVALVIFAFVWLMLLIN